jgi:peptide/nickel transport system ATP-binding protein
MTVTGSGPDSPLISVRDLRISFDGGSKTVVDGVSFDLHRDEVLGIVGESGSGKTLTCLSLLSLLPADASAEGSIELSGTRVIGASELTMRRLRGREVGVVFQGALAGFNPVQTMGDQIAEALKQGGMNSRRARDERVGELLEIVGIGNPRQRAKQYPHEFSGGMRQRAMIAMALANDPEVIIADEPTTALDITVQAEILNVLRRVKERTRCSIILVTHDLGVVAGIADRVLVMYGGRIAEVGPTDDVFLSSAHPYTRALIACRPRIETHASPEPIPGSPPVSVDSVTGCIFHPRCGRAALPDPCEQTRPVGVAVAPGHEAACHFAREVAAQPIELALPEPVVADVSVGQSPDAGPLLEVVDLVKHFPARGRGIFGKGVIHSVCGVSFALGRGETLGIVGESGSGKSTIARCILGLEKPTSGQIRFGGVDTAAMSRREIGGFRKRVQIVFQDPYSSLNPNMTVNAIVGDPLRVHGVGSPERQSRVADALRMVGIDPTRGSRLPRSFSGGERQRIGIARALVLEPELLVLDEPLSALDVSVQAGIIRLLQRLQRSLNLAYIVIAHDLAVVRQLAEQVVVLHAGKIVELGGRDEVYEQHAHPYTQALLSAVPTTDPNAERVRERIVLQGDYPDPVAPPSGCRFRSRCWLAADVCATQEPLLELRGGEHPVACHFADDLAANVGAVETIRPGGAS